MIRHARSLPGWTPHPAWVTAAVFAALLPEIVDVVRALGRAVMFVLVGVLFAGVLCISAVVRLIS